ncbi:MAG: FecR domain-containing protein [Symploca sp. SIO2B6]|nr:FecR domain-containing protein [Symploca sp. SIO2B6]
MKLQHWPFHHPPFPTSSHRESISPVMQRSRTQRSIWLFSQRRMFLGLFLSAVLILPWLAQTVQSYTLPVRVDRWLEVRQVSGDVTYSYAPDNQIQPATVGETRLQRVGDRMTTGEDSNATLLVDTGIGFVEIFDNTDLQIDELTVTASGGRVTRLNIMQGRAQLRVRSFLNPESELEIRTPAGVSGVRGTQFGVGVNPNGQTGVLTEEGQVTAEAQGVTVYVDAGFQSLIVPGEPPTPPIPITNDVTLDIIDLQRDGDSVYIEGRIDPLSQLTIDEEPRDVEPDGRFSFRVPREGRDRIPATVSTLSGSRQDYELAVP